MTAISSWGKAKECDSSIHLTFKPEELSGKTALVVGSLLSYGDSCLNDQNVIIKNSTNDCILSFDPDKKIIKAQAGISFEVLLEFLVPRGFFLPVTPGTKYITLGGAVANDVHGKNHHMDGTFGNWIKSFKLNRSDGEFICSPDENTNLFQATIGGLGLTGYIEWCEFEVISIKSSNIAVETIKFNSLDDFLDINQKSMKYKYTVAWFDCLSSRAGKDTTKGLYMRGNPSANGALEVHPEPGIKQVPIEFPSFCLNKLSVSAFNFLYFNKQQSKKIHSLQHYDPFFYPLDMIKNWNNIYGKKGFYQFQCVLPFDQAHKGLQDILNEIARSGQGSFLSVLKTFGTIKSPGMLSFPKEGITLALDFANRGASTRILMDKLYKIVEDSQGSIYPAKDQILSKEQFEKFYPNFNDFEKYVDPNLCSDWWRRARGIK